MTATLIKNENGSYNVKFDGMAVSFKPKQYVIDKTGEVVLISVNENFKTDYRTTGYYIKALKGIL